MLVRPYIDDIHENIEWQSFVPRTQTVNQDRLYFTGCKGNEKLFRKVDFNIERGIAEAQLMLILDHPAIPEVKYYFKRKDKAVIDFEFVPGNTLEFLIEDGSYLRSYHRSAFNRIAAGLFDVFNYMMHRGVVHGDINVSNVLFDGHRIYLIDWEMGKLDHNHHVDLFGPPWGIMDTLRRVANACKLQNAI